jgi:hypothetical protein
MFVANLMVAFLLGQVQTGGPELDRDPLALVARLGANRYADREKAAEALEHLGRSALPALRAARDSSDLEVRTRASGLIEKIDGAMLTQPTRVRLDFDGMPLTDVVRSLSLQAGFKVALFPENLPRWKSTRVTLHTAEPVDFWRAVDQLRAVAGLQYNPGMSGYAGQREPTFSQADVTVRSITPISDHGPFRVSLLGLHYQRDLNYDTISAVPRLPIPHDGKPPAALGTAGVPAQVNPVANVQFSARLLVAAEPRLSLYQNGPLQMIEAVDNRGNSLVPITSDGPTYNRVAGYFGMANGPVIQLQAQLHRPELAGEVIKKLRGTIPVTVSSRKPDPLVVSLINGIGKTVDNSEVQLTVHELRFLPNSQNSLVELSVRANDPNASVGRNDVEGFSAVLQRTDPQHLQIEVIDTRGQLIPWFPSGADSETARVTLTLTKLPETTQPKELRYYTLTRASLSLPFEFKDMFMP